MGEIQEDRYICKICSKICVSGKSLGGHMRIHLALISASKKAAKEIKIEDDHQFETEEKIKDGDVDQNTNYQLRENPKKSWRVSDPKHALNRKCNSCVECGKVFPSLRALSGHMRCHSTKNKEVHNCEKCGRGFNSIRAMFGHMKSHSKKSRLHNDSTDSLSDLENLCPVRRKRSRIGYKSSPNASDSGLAMVEEAAMCLVMLSRGVKDFVTESSDDDDEDFVYLGAESSHRSKKFSKGFPEKNESVFENVVSEDEILSVENGTKVDFDRVLKPEFDDELRAFDCAKSAEFESNCGKKVICSVHASGFENAFGNEANGESTSEGGVSLESSKSKEYECVVCFKVFSSGQALGGHKRAHFSGQIESKKKESMAMIMNQEVAEIQDALDLNFPAAVDEGIKNNVWRSPQAEALVFSN